MSYARFGEDSNVYVYAGCSGMYECCMCHLSNGKLQQFKTTMEIIDHLDKHLDAGHKVPSYTFVGLGEELEQERIIELIEALSNTRPTETNLYGNGYSIERVIALIKGENK